MGPCSDFGVSKGASHMSSLKTGYSGFEKAPADRSPGDTGVLSNRVCMFMLVCRWSFFGGSDERVS